MELIIPVGKRLQCRRVSALRNDLWFGRDLILMSRSSNFGDSDSDIFPMIFKSSTYFHVQLQAAEHLSLVSGIEQGRR